MFNLDYREQKKLENVIEKVISKARNYFKTRRDTFTTNEREGNEQINLDGLAKDTIFQEFQDMPIFTEEGSIRFLKEGLSELVVSDPIDGSSLVNLMGPYSSPTSTSIMEIRKSRGYWEIVAAAVGDLWKKQIYGIDKEGLYKFRVGSASSGKKRYVHLKPRGEEPIILAAYAQSNRRADMAIEVFQLVKSKDISKFINDGGGMYNLRVVSNSKDALTCAVELLPVPLYEHIPVFVASKGGAKVSRLDGTELELNPYVKQTAIVARNDDIRKNLIQLLQYSYGRLGILHREEILINE